MPPLTSVELNLLVLRYFQDSGFEHSHFMFGKEAALSKCPFDGSLVPPGALVTLVQKGLMYIEMEANLTDPDDSDMYEDLSFLQPMDLITKSAEELQKIIKEKREEKIIKEKREEKIIKEKREEKSGNIVKKSIPKKVRFVFKQGQQKPPQVPKERKTLLHGTGSEPLGVRNVRETSVMVLKGHSNEVLCCAWSPTDSILASGSGDATARIWTVALETNRSSTDVGSSNEIVLNHGVDKAHTKTKDVIALHWNGDGTLLATASFDGHARIWSKNGELISTLGKHKAPMMSLKWNKSGDYILTGSTDNSAIVWDVKARRLLQHFETYAGPAIDWRDNTSFATISPMDHMIHVYRIGERNPIKSFWGHKEVVNCTTWDPTGSLLASGSDDTTAKIWSMEQHEAVLDLKGHSRQVYIVRWRPTEPGTENLNQPSILASGSFDSTVKVWDIHQGKLIYTLDSHRDSVYGLAFSPNGEYLATGSVDRCVHIWSVKHKKIIKEYKGNGMIFELSWNSRGDQLASCSSDNRVCVFDLRR